MRILCTTLFILFGLFKFVFSLPHPIQDADNSTRCAFPFLPTGYLTIGKTISVPGECMSVTCQEDLTISGLTCPAYFEIPGCYETEINKYKDYPDCCPILICPGFERYPINVS